MTIQNLIDIVTNKTLDEAVAEIKTFNDKLSTRAVKNIVLDIQDHIDEKMGKSELEYRVSEAGL